MKREKTLLDSDTIRITDRALYCGNAIHTISGIDSCSFSEYTPKGRSNCWFTVGGLTFGIGAAIHAVALKAAVVFAVISVVIMLIGINMRTPKTKYTLKVDIGDRETTAFTTSNSELFLEVRKAMERAFELEERNKRKAAE